ncbi:hypothetical protein HZZ00_37840 (plasmid) [Streptomyces sp. NEAU-sy36]|uniref:hypothetical protein n=1 Tax=unclassified Streptomyces TaxID=2593676 RepID=UPI0015D5D938|nr:MULTISPECIES: hypothetical protein [unclassified Streptomyces]QLJ06794.1 hypothetical protein HZZ00_37840 [Streptomyces sp. NEAU-sy36]
MSTLSPEQRGELAEQMLPVAANLAVLVHGDGGPEDVAEVLGSLDSTQKDALLVVLAGLVDPDQPVGKALGWLDFDEHGSLTVPSWSEQRSVRDLVPEPSEDLDGDYVDQVAVSKFVHGFRVDSITDAEFLTAVQQCVAQGMTLADVNRLRRWPAKTAENWVHRLRKQYQRSGRVFPSLAQQSQQVLTEAQVVAIRERSHAGATDLEVAMSFGITQKAVGDICRGKRYPRFGGPIRQPKQVHRLPATREFMCGHADNSRAGRRNQTKENAA